VSVVHHSPILGHPELSVGWVDPWVGSLNGPMDNSRAAARRHLIRETEMALIHCSSFRSVWRCVGVSSVSKPRRCEVSACVLLKP